MKKVLIVSLIVAMVVGIGILSAAPGEKGNGLPKGKSYNLNIIGIPKGVNYNKELNDNFTGGEGKRIFIQRTGTTAFYVYGDDTTTYEVLDHNGTDGKVGEPGRGLENAGITFPYDTASETWGASIWVRLLGPNSPDNYMDGATWGYDTDGSIWVLLTTWRWNRDTPSKFSVKTGDLLIDGYQDIIWYMTPGDKFRILQMRVYLD